MAGNYKEMQNASQVTYVYQLVMWQNHNRNENLDGHTSNNARHWVASEGVCEREEGERETRADYFSDALLDITWTHCPNHSLAEGLVQDSSVHSGCDMGK